MLEVKRVRHSYSRAGQAALNAINLNIARGERVSIVGESGSGKSTLLTVLCGLLSPTAGEVLLNGMPIRLVAPYRRDISLVLQAPPDIRGMTVGQLLARPAARGHKKADIAKVIEHALNTIGLSGLEKRQLDSLSGGQRQRAHIARSLVWRPTIMAFDEPFSNIDIQTKRELVPIILQHRKECDSSLIVITHDPAEALALGERIVVLREGRLVTDESADAIVRSASDSYAAMLFAGLNSNLIRGELRRIAENGYEVALPFGTYRGSFAQKQSLPVAGDVNAFLTASEIRLVRSSGPRGARSFTVDWLQRSGDRRASIAIAHTSFGTIYATEDDEIASLDLTFELTTKSLVLFSYSSQQRIGTLDLDGRD
jgi:ABC-type sugar transport system ATPase subunit